MLRPRLLLVVLVVLVYLILLILLHKKKKRRSVKKESIQFKIQSAPPCGRSEEVSLAVCFSLFGGRMYTTTSSTSLMDNKGIVI